MIDGSPHDDTGDGHEAQFTVTFDDSERARRVRAAVGREVGEIDDGRSRATLGGEKQTVEVTVDARDVSAVRAATDTWLGLVEAAGRTAAVAERAAIGSERMDGNSDHQRDSSGESESPEAGSGE